MPIGTITKAWAYGRGTSYEWVCGNGKRHKNNYTTAFLWDEAYLKCAHCGESCKVENTDKASRLTPKTATV